MRSMIFSILALTLSCSDIASQISEKQILRPKIDGEWWAITGNPDLGEITNPRQQPVDFGVWLAGDGTWQLWSCIRSTNEPGKTRLFFGWEGKSITDVDWTPKGIKMKADPLLGETAGGLQAPYIFREGETWHMYYGDWNAICHASSTDGKMFERIIQSNLERVPAIFTEGAGTNSRDPMVIKEGEMYYCYYTGGVGFLEDGAQEKMGAIYCRTSKDQKHWSNSTIVSRGGRTGDGWFAHECPFVVKIGNYFYLFRTQQYGLENISTVYRSLDPLNFGIGTDEGYFVTQLQVAAPELINYQGQWYIFALNPELNGIRVALLKWSPE